MDLCFSCATCLLNDWPSAILKAPLPLYLKQHPTSNHQSGLFRLAVPEKAFLLIISDCMSVSFWRLLKIGRSIFGHCRAGILPEFRLGALHEAVPQPETMKNHDYDYEHEEAGKMPALLNFRRSADVPVRHRPGLSLAIIISNTKKLTLSN